MGSPHINDQWTVGVYMGAVGRDVWPYGDHNGRREEVKLPRSLRGGDVFSHDLWRDQCIFI